MVLQYLAGKEDHHICVWSEIRFKLHLGCIRMRLHDLTGQKTRLKMC